MGGLGTGSVRSQSGSIVLDFRDANEVDLHFTRQDLTYVHVIYKVAIQIQNLPFGGPENHFL